MTVNLASYIESINNPNGRFRTIRAVYPLKSADGDLIMYVGDLTADFEVMLKKHRYWLRCILSVCEEEKERLKEVATFIKLMDSDYLGEFTYMENELLIFDSSDSYLYRDILVERIPDGVTIVQLVGNLYENGEEIPVSKLLKQLTALSEWLFKNQFAHGKRMQKAIIVDPASLELKLIDYTYTRRAVPLEELNDILVLALQLYLIGCDSRLTVNFTAKRKDSRSLGQKNFLQQLPKLISKIQNEAPPALMSLLNGLRERNGLNNAEQILENINTLSNLEIVHFKLLSDALDLKHARTPKEDAYSLGERFKRYKYVAEMHNMLIRVFDGEWWHYLDKTGKAVISGNFLDAFDFYEGRAVVETKSGYGLINVDGEYVIAPEFDDLEYDYTSGLIIVTTNGQSSIYDREGNSVAKRSYDLVMTPREGLITVKKDRKFGFINYAGELVIPIKYDDAFSFRDGVARVVYKERDYLIDSKGEIVSELHNHKELVFTR